jgi:hypothetical protein
MRDGLKAVLPVSPALDRDAVLLIIVAEAIAVVLLIPETVETNQE